MIEFLANILYDTTLDTLLNIINVFLVVILAISITVVKTLGEHNEL